MKLTFKLYASLTRYLPAGAKDHRVVLEVPNGTSSLQLLEQHGVPQADVHLVLVNGVFIPHGERARPLREGDELAAWPAVAGG